MEYQKPKKISELLFMDLVIPIYLDVDKPDDIKYSSGCWKDRKDSDIAGKIVYSKYIPSTIINTPITSNYGNPTNVLISKFSNTSVDGKFYSKIETSNIEIKEETEKIYLEDWVDARTDFEKQLIPQFIVTGKREITEEDKKIIIHEYLTKKFIKINTNLLTNKEKFLLLVGDNPRPSKWVEESKFRKENKILIKQSQEIALTILLYLEENDISKEEFSKITNISLENLTLILKGQGKYILSNEELSTISNITKQDLSIYSNKE